MAGTDLYPIKDNVQFIPNSLPVGASLPTATPTPFAFSEQRRDDFLPPPTTDQIAPTVTTGELYENRKYAMYDPTKTEEQYAYGQSAWDKAGNGLAKLAGTTATTLANNTVGLLYGIGAALGNQKFSSLYDNDFFKNMDNISKEMENRFPHYYTESEQKDPLSLSSIFTGNFFWDKIIKNLGFSAGAAISGLGASALLEGIGLSKGLMAAGKGLQALEATEAAIAEGKTIGGVVQALKSSKNTLSKFGGVLEELGTVSAGAKYSKANQLFSAYLGTTGEAAMESYQNKHQFVDNEIKDWKDKHDGQEPTGADLQKIQTYADSVGNWSFVLNTALLTGTEYIQLPKIFGSTYSGDKKILNDILFKDGAWTSALPEKGFGKFLYKSKNIGSLFFNTAEAFEEGAQFAIQEGTNNFFKRKYRDNEKTSFWNSLAHLAMPGGEGVLGFGAKQALTTKEGLENILLGGLSGALMTSGVVGLKANEKGENRIAFGQTGKLGERGFSGYGGETGANITTTVNALNSAKFSDLIDSINRGFSISEDRDQSIRLGDILQSKDLETDYMLNYLLPRIKHGGSELFNIEINEMRQRAATEEGFGSLIEQGTANQNDTRPNFLKRLDNIHNMATAVNENYSSYKTAYGGIAKVDENGKLILDENGKPQRKYDDDTLDRMVYATSKIHDYDNRIPGLINTLSEKGILASDLMYETSKYGDPSPKKLKDAIDAINELDTTDAIKQELTRNLHDSLELTKRRDNYIDEFNSMMEDPAKFKDETPITPEFVDPSGDVKTIEAGREYEIPEAKVAKIEKLDDDKWQVTAPNGEVTLQDTEEDATQEAEKLNEDAGNLSKIKVLDVNADGSVNIEDADGNYQTIPAEVFNGYEKVESRQEKLFKYYEAVDQFNADLEKTSGEVGTGDAVEDAEEEKELAAEYRKKAASIMYLATKTESEDWDDTDESALHVTRSREFLNSAKNFKNRSDLRVVLVSYSNEKALGLDGLAALSFNFGKGELTDAQKARLTNLTTGFLAQVYTNSKGKFVNKNGEEITEGDVLDQVVFQTMPSAVTEGTNDKGKKYPLYRAGEKAAAEAQLEGYKLLREQLFNDKGQAPPTYYKFTISRGLATEVLVNGVKEKNSVVDTLLPKDKAENLIATQQGLITIVTDGSINHEGQTYRFPKGKPVLQFGDTLVSLNNQKINSNLAETIYQILKLAHENIADLSAIKPQMLFLQSVLFYTSNTKSTAQNRVFIDPKTMDLYLGKTGKFDISNIDNLESEIKEVLSNIYVNINNTNLTTGFNNKFREFYMKDGKLTNNVWDNYQTYLLSNKYPNGSARPISDTPLVTSVAKITDAVPYNFKQKYSVLSTQLEIPVTAPKAKPTAKSTIIPGQENNIGKFDGNNKVNTTETKEETISFKLNGKEYRATQGESGITIIQNEEYKKLQDRVGVEKAEQYIFYVVDQELQNEAPAVPATPAAPAVTPIGPVVITPMDIIEEKKADVKGTLANQGTSIELEVKGDTGKEFLLTVDRKGNISLFSEKQPDGSYKSGEAAPKEAIDKLYNKYVSEKTRTAITNWLNSFTGSWAALETEDGKNYTKAEKELNAELAALESGAPTQAPTAPTPTQAGEVSRFAKTKRKDKYRAATGEKKERMTDADLTFFKEWHAAKLPKLPYEVLNRMVTMTNGKKAFGVYVNGIAKFVKGGERGTEYHEIFHGIFNSFLSEEDRQVIFGEMGNREGEFKDRISRKIITYAEATEDQLEDKLADEFAEFRLGKLPARTLGERIVQFFRNILKYATQIVDKFKGKDSVVDDLFASIEKGKFKNATPNETGISSIPKYRAVESLTDKETHELIQDMSIWAGNFLFGEDLENIYDFQKITGSELFSKIEEVYIEDGKRDELGDQAWNDLVQRTKEQLRVLVGLQFNDEDVIDLSANDNSNNREYERDPFTIGIKDASYGVKLLIGLLPKTDNSPVAAGDLPNRQVTDNQTYKLVNHLAVSGTLLDKLSNTTGRDEVVAKLADLANYDRDYVRLFARLGGDPNTLTFNFGDFNNNQWRLWVDFVQTFTKQKPESFVQYINGSETYLGSANLFTAVDNLQSTWMTNIRALAKQPEALIKLNKKKIYEADEEAFKKTPVSNKEEKVAFLNKIGIDLPMDTYLKLSDDNQDVIDDEATKLHAYLQKTKELATLSGKTLNVKGRFKTIAETLIRATNPLQDSTFQGIDGKTRQSYAQNNALSILANEFNQANNLDELMKARPELKDVFSTHSILLEKKGPFWDKDGNKIPGAKLIVDLAGGSLDEIKDKGVGTVKLNKGARFLQELNFNLNGIYYVINAGDSSSEWAMNIGNHILFSDVQGGEFGWEAINKVFKGYLQDDVALALDFANRSELKNVGKKAKQLRFFNDILSPELLEEFNKAITKKATKATLDKLIDDNIESINASIKVYIQEQATELKNALVKQSQLELVDDGVYSFIGLDSDFAESADVKLNKKKLSEKDVTDLMTYIIANKNIANIEFHKILFGDPYQFKVKMEEGIEILDETKRIKSFESPRETSYDDVDFNNFNTTNYSKTGLEDDEDRITLEGPSEKNPVGDPGYDVMKDHLKTVTISNTDIVGSLLGKTDESDAASFMMDKMYRQVKLKNKQWPKESELWHQWQMAYTRNKLAASKDYEYTNEALRKHDEALIKKPEPVFVTEVLKPIVSGNEYGVDYINNILDKFSQMPIYYKNVEGTNLEGLYKQMWKQDVDYVITESGRKLGVKETHDLYVGGRLNEAPFAEKTIVNVPWKAYGIQVENTYDAKNGEGTTGSQATKVSSINLFKAGKPNTKDPKRAEVIQKAYDRNMTVKKNILINSYAILLKKMGLRDNGTSFEVINRKALAESLEYEMLRLNVSDNVKDLVRLDSNNEFPIPFEASFAYRQIKDIINSMVDKTIIRPKTSGGSYVQAPVTGWENAKAGRRIAIKTKEGYKELSREAYDKLSDAEKKKVVLTDDTLKFYEDKDGKRYCEIMLPHWFKQQIGKSLKYDTDEAILKYLNTTPEGQSILRGVGFRIPTQAMSSMEVFKVKGFLPQSMGKTVVVPSEITTKAGSDFDIDKLNLYLKAIYKDKDGDIRLVKYKGSETATREFFSDVFDQVLETKKIKKSELLEATQILAYGLDDPKDLLGRYGDLLNVLLADVADSSDFEASMIQQLEKLGDSSLQAVLKDKFVDGMYKKALENEYYDSLEEILTLPENFKQLTTPVSDGGLEKVAARLNQLKGLTNIKVKNKILNSVFLTNLRHGIAIAKGWVGITAVNVTGLSMTQKADVYLDPSRIVEIDPVDRKFLGNGKILLKHNLNDRGYSSYSGVTNQSGELISDKLSGYTTGVVDVNKKQYILDILKSDNVIGTAMLLERFGVDNVGIFLNQPVILEYLELLDGIGSPTLFNQALIDKVLNKFGDTSKGLVDSTVALNEDKFEENIQKYYDPKQKLSPAENAEQHLILSEFLKYAKMAEYAFAMTQATNYDTSTFKGGDALYRQQLRTQKAIDTNIFVGIEDMLNNTFLATEANILARANEAAGEVFKLEKEEFTNYTNSVLAPFAANKYLGQDDYMKIGNKIKLSFLDFIIQTESSPKLNNSLTLLNDSTNGIATQLAEAKVNHPEMEILQYLEIVEGKNQESTKSVKLLVNLRGDAYSENLFTGYMRELKNNPGTNELFNNLVKVAILQGAYKSPISIGNIIPLEDYSRAIKPIIDALQPNINLEAFYNLGLFQRTNWKDSSIFKRVEPKFRGEYNGAGEVDFYTSESYFPNLESAGIGTNDRKILTLSEKYSYIGTQYDFVGFPRIIEQTKGGMPTGRYIDALTGYPINTYELKERAKNGDMSGKQFFGYQRVTNEDGSPFIIYENEERKHVYKLINLYGDGQLATEFRTDGKPSLLNNNTFTIDKEFTNTQVRNFFGANPAISIVDTITDIPEVSVVETANAILNTGTQPATSNKPEFSKLPSVSSTPTMTYAGIGSRQTPPEVLKQMTELAKELESKGYTLRSGGAEGADTAFESGTTKKEIFKGFDQAGEIERRIAHEIHPNLKGAMEASQKRATAAGKNGERSAWAVENLMARNTNQIFGKNLNTPSDFVVFYAKETKGIRPEGGTGQAVEMARLKGIPTINLANPNWRAELNKALAGQVQKTEDQPKGEQVKEGIYVNQAALSKDEQLELFNYLKPFLEEQASKTNKGAYASKMIGLGLRWDYKSNNADKTAMDIPDVINKGNKNKYGYYDTSINGQPLGQITPRFRELMEKATGVDMTDYDGAIINLYDNDSFISSHNDVDESISALKYPVIGINLGGTGNFSIESRDSSPKQLNLKAGTGYVFGVNGVNREVYHRTFPGKQDSFLPAITTKLDGKTYEPGSYRVTITMRRVMPIEPWTPSSPAIKKEAQSTKAQPVIDSSKKINIYAGTGENAELSNFAVRPFSETWDLSPIGMGFGTLAFNTVEGAFQASKILYSGDLNNYNLLPQFQKASGAEAKALGKQVKRLDTKAWDANSSRIMKELMKASFEQNPSALKALLATGNAELTHTQESPKSKWRTEFPKLLMEVRSELSGQPVVDMGRQVDIEPGLGLTKENFETPEGYDEFLAEQSAENQSVITAPESTVNIFDLRKNTIDYTAGQTKALNDVKALIDSGKEGYYLLAGYAGTGKTTIAENIVKYAEASKKVPYVLAPTNKAVKVLSDKLSDTGAATITSTIHKALYGEPDPDTGEWIPQAKIKNALVLIDESSMISKELMADLLELTKDRNNVLVFMGDRFQLEPVGEDSGLFKGDVYQVNNSQSELTEVKRQALDSNVLKVATITRVDGKPYVPSASMKDFTIVNTKNEFVNAFKKSVKEGESSVAIVATNNERITMNQAARMEKFGPNRKILNVGETLVAIANSSDLSNSEIFTADAIQGEPIKYSLPLKNKDKIDDYDLYLSEVKTNVRVIDVDASGKFVTKIQPSILTVLHFPNVDKASVYHAEILKSARENNPALYNEFKNRNLLITTKKGIKLSPNVIVSTYGYAVTAHKSQGSQWDKVFVNQNYSAKEWNPARWYYTAITRSAKEVIVLPSQYNIRITPQAIENKLNTIVTETATTPKSKKDLFNVIKAKEQKSFRGKKLEFVDKIPTSKDTIVAMQNDKKTGVIKIDELAMRNKFASQAWTKPATQLDGSKATPLAKNEFATFNEFLTFALLHEVKHDTILKQDGETTGAYEDRINQAALTDLQGNYKLASNKQEVAPEKEEKETKCPHEGGSSI